MSTPRAHLRPRPLRSMALIGAVGVVAACGTEPPSETPQAEVSGGAIGPDVMVNAKVSLLQVQIPYPADGVYSPGEDVPLAFAISNTGEGSVELTDISGPDFSDAVTADGGDPGITVADGETVFVGSADGPTVVLTGLDTDLHSAESIPVQFDFAEAGSVTVQAMVTAQGRAPAPSA